jgi:peroxiredoxin
MGSAPGASSAATAEPTPTPPRSRAYEPAPSVGSAPDELGLAVGAPAPDATLKTIDGSETTLQAQLGEGATMLVFYRGGWCPYCNFQIRELTENHASFAERGVKLVLVSVDRIEESARTSATYEIPFAVLSDSDLAAHRAFRVLQEVDAPTRERLAGMGIDLEAASGRDHHTIAVPSVFVIRDGTVVFRHVEPDYRTRPTVPQLLAALDDLDDA